MAEQCKQLNTMITGGLLVFIVNLLILLCSVVNILISLVNSVVPPRAPHFSILFQQLIVTSTDEFKLFKPAGCIFAILARFGANGGAKYATY